MEPKTSRPRFQFSLKELFLLLTAIAVALAAVRIASVFLFLVLLIATVCGVIIAAIRAVAGEWHWRVFYGCITVVGVGGVVLTLIEHFPSTGTPLIQAMWWNVTDWGRGFSWRHVFTFFASAGFASAILIETWIAALVSGAFLGLLFFVVSRWLRSRR